MFDRDTLNTIRRLLDNYPDRIVDVLNSLSENQYSSKDWLIEKLNEYPHHFKYKSLDKKINICLLASWYGLLAYKMIDKFKLKQIANIEPKKGKNITGNEPIILINITINSSRLKLNIRIVLKSLRRSRQSSAIFM